MSLSSCDQADGAHLHMTRKVVRLNLAPSPMRACQVIST